MKIVLESLRFYLIFFIFGTILTFITHLVFFTIGVDPEKFSWIAIVGAFIFMFVLYRNRGWGKKYNNLILWSSVILIVLFILVIPDTSPTHLHTSIYVYSYGFPDAFLTLYIEDGTSFIIPNLFSKRIMNWDVYSFGLLVNFIVMYLSLQFIFKYVTKEKIL
ncbi:hypothetical protein [Paraliobacillus sediminis]|uniref:hypothetical protein n=1 Tax=Paraliobacillus sediminis TaxID=1885916 RepID=UPI000E3E14FC|nr:hypothetical protein [Paraliobacillus sediminis]